MRSNLKRIYKEIQVVILIFSTIFKKNGYQIFNMLKSLKTDSSEPGFRCKKTDVSYL